MYLKMQTYIRINAEQDVPYSRLNFEHARKDCEVTSIRDAFCQNKFFEESYLPSFACKLHVIVDSFCGGTKISLSSQCFSLL